MVSLALSTLKPPRGGRGPPAAAGFPHGVTILHRAAASRAAAALASVAHVDKERLELQSAREETKMRLLKQIPAHQQ